MLIEDGALVVLTIPSEFVVLYAQLVGAKTPLKPVITSLFVKVADNVAI